MGGHQAIAEREAKELNIHYRLRWQAWRQAICR